MTSVPDNALLPGKVGHHVVPLIADRIPCRHASSVRAKAAGATPMCLVVSVSKKGPTGAKLSLATDDAEALRRVAVAVRPVVAAVDDTCDRVNTEVGIVVGRVPSKQCPWGCDEDSVV